MASKPIVVTILLNGAVTQKVEVVKDRILIGRSEECDVRIDNVGVSRQHAVITSSPEATLVEDLNSANGTLLNGERVKIIALKSGDILQIGKFSLHIAFTETGKGVCDPDPSRGAEPTVEASNTPPSATPTSRGGRRDRSPAAR